MEEPIEESDEEEKKEETTDDDDDATVEEEGDKPKTKKVLERTMISYSLSHCRLTKLCGIGK